MVNAELIDADPACLARELARELEHERERFFDVETDIRIDEDLDDDAYDSVSDGIRGVDVESVLLTQDAVDLLERYLRTAIALGAREARDGERRNGN